MRCNYLFFFSTEKYFNFFKAVVNLPSFPFAVVYLILIPASLLWKQHTSPLGLQKVIIILMFNNNVHIL